MAVVTDVSFQVIWLVFSVDLDHSFAAAAVPNLLSSAYPSMLSNALCLMDYRQVASACETKNHLSCKTGRQLVAHTNQGLPVWAFG